jgi:hypothetical protein
MMKRPISTPVIFPLALHHIFPGRQQLFCVQMALSAILYRKANTGIVASSKFGGAVGSGRVSFSPFHQMVKR